jgi:hypothetical protein
VTGTRPCRVGPFSAAARMRPALLRCNQGVERLNGAPCLSKGTTAPANGLRSSLNIDYMYLPESRRSRHAHRGGLVGREGGAVPEQRQFRARAFHGQVLPPSGPPPGGGRRDPRASKAACYRGHQRGSLGGVGVGVAQWQEAASGGETGDRARARAERKQTCHLGQPYGGGSARRSVCQRGQEKRKPSAYSARGKLRRRARALARAAPAGFGVMSRQALRRGRGETEGAASGVGAVRSGGGIAGPAGARAAAAITAVRARAGPSGGLAARAAAGPRRAPPLPRRRGRVGRAGGGGRWCVLNPGCEREEERRGVDSRTGAQGTKHRGSRGWAAGAPAGAPWGARLAGSLAARMGRAPPLESHPRGSRAHARRTGAAWRGVLSRCGAARGRGAKGPGGRARAWEDRPGADGAHFVCRTQAASGPAPAPQLPRGQQGTGTGHGALGACKGGAALRGRRARSRAGGVQGGRGPAREAGTQQGWGRARGARPCEGGGHAAGLGATWAAAGLAGFEAQKWGGDAGAPRFPVGAKQVGRNSRAGGGRQPAGGGRASVCALGGPACRKWRTGAPPHCIMLWSRRPRAGSGRPVRGAPRAAPRGRGGPGRARGHGARRGL